MENCDYKTAMKKLSDYFNVHRENNKKASTELWDYEWKMLGVEPDMVSKNLDINLVAPGESPSSDADINLFLEQPEQLKAFKDRYHISLNVLRKSKINPRTFLTNFTSSSVFPLSQEDFKKLKPELKRLHIPYMQYKTTKSMRDNETIEISVSKENAERFIRLAENLGIASVAPYDMHTDELTEAEYEQALKDGNAKGVDVSVSPDGITTVNERENPMQAPSDILNQSAPNSNEFEPFTLRFNETDGIRENLKLASLLQPPF